MSSPLDTHLVLVGPMASGKSSVGRQVAEHLGAPFLDTDATIVAEHGSIADLFAKRGEAHFRALEEQAVAEALSATTPSIIALGGGAVLSEKTRALLAAYPVVLLLTNEATVLSRANLEKRPLLREDPAAWQRIFDERLPLYQEVATVSFDTGIVPKEVAAAEIINWLEGRNGE